MQIIEIRRLGPVPGGNAGNKTVKVAETVQNPVVI
jgi:hypothetical protein